MILKVQEQNNNQVSTRDHFQIDVRLERPKTYFSLIIIIIIIIIIYYV